MELPRVCQIRLHAFAGSVTVHSVHGTHGENYQSSKYYFNSMWTAVGKETALWLAGGILIVDQFAQP